MYSSVLPTSHVMVLLLMVQLFLYLNPNNKNSIYILESVSTEGTFASYSVFKVKVISHKE